MKTLSHRNRQSFAKAAMVSTALAAVAAVAIPSWASSHREAPAITKSPKVDATDFYMFRSYEPGRQDYVTFIANYQGLQDAYGGPNYFTMDPDAFYQIHIDSDGDAIEDITFSFDFDNALENGTGKTINAGGLELPIPLRSIGPVTAGDSANLGETETYKVSVITGDRRSGAWTEVAQTFTKPLDNVGNKTLPDYQAYADQYVYDNVTLPGCSRPSKIFVGQRADAFAVNLGEIFDLVNLVPIEGQQPQSPANNDLADKNVSTIAMEVPIECVTGNGNGVIGAWTTASLPQARLLDPTPSYEQNALEGGAYVQVSRLSAPLVNEVVIGLPFKDLFNHSEPKDDAQAADFVTNPTLPELLEALFPVEAPNNFPRTDLVAAFLTGFPGVNQQATVTGSEMMRLNTGIDATPQATQSNFGVAGNDLAGFPNGRRPGDDVVDIALRVVMGALCHDIPVGGVPTNLGYCMPADAPNGDTPFTDFAPVSAADVQNAFPYLNTPYAGSPN